MLMNANEYAQPYQDAYDLRTNMSNPNASVEELANAVTEGDPDKSMELVTRLLGQRIEPIKILSDGLTKGLMVVGERFGKGDAFLTDLLMSAEAMKSGLRVVEPELKKSKEEPKHLGTVVIGTVEGDIHDIGKSIVVTMLEVNGFKVYDLGCDIKTESFLEKAEEVKPNIIGLSALLSTTMLKQAEVIKALNAKGARSRVKVLIGGAPITPEWARQIGADGSAPDAISAVAEAKKVVAAS